ncbi:MAG: ABC transporter permease [Bacillota bacterium]|nr:ABC transporter permease [Bacillota bacterium]MDI7248576.1 ABC transporter permease [Bacillota bacterium]
MELIWDGLRTALGLVVGLDPQVLEVSLLTLQVSGLATVAALLAGLFTGALLALGRFPGRRFLQSVINAGMGLPPVVVGLAVCLLLWRSGPLGGLRLIYTPAAMVTAQFVIAYPVMAGLSAAALQQVGPAFRLQVEAMGASRLQLLGAMLWEARYGVLGAVIASFGSVISEVGASMMVGGNVVGQTRVLTTAIVLEVNRGNFDVAIALSLILLGLTYGAAAALTLVQQRKR